MPSAAPVRILIVDDSAVMRSLLRSVLQTDARLQVVAAVGDGVSALEAINLLRPDLVLLDVEMPGMDGLETLRQIQASRLRTRVIMCSSLTRRGGRVTIEALASGAADYVAKPSGQTSRDAALAALAHELIPKILALTAPKSSAPLPAPSRGLSIGPAPRPPTSVHLPSPGTPTFAQMRPAPGFAALSAAAAPTSQALPHASPAVVLIGVSTGGPAALDELLPALPGDFPMPILVVQHMPELFTSLLAERLNARCALSVAEARHGDPVVAGRVYLARGDWHMSVAAEGASAAARVLIRLTQGPPENHCRPSVDVLFRSAAPVYGARAVGVVLTGMGSDGLAGCRVLREHHATILAQDQATCAVWGMPAAVANAGLAHRVLPLGAIAPELLRLVQRSEREALELREPVVSAL